MRSKAAKVALCGVVSALSVVLMLMTGIVPIATIALPALAGCLTTVSYTHLTLPTIA